MNIEERLAAIERRLQALEAPATVYGPCRNAPEPYTLSPEEIERLKGWATCEEGCSNEIR